MYGKASCRVTANNTLSSSFPCRKGVKQGCNLSPLLFSLYISDLESYLETNIAGKIALENLKIQLLLFADDLVLLADSEQGLQHSMNRLDEFCSTWDMQVNIQKTNVVIFNKSRNQSTPFFKIGEDTIKYSSNYKYLGITLTENGSNKLAITTLANQTSKALFALMRGASKLSFPKPSLLCHLFDTLVKPVAEYGSEIWGHAHAEELEIIHRKFCKFALGLPRTTTNLACYGELGRYPLVIRRKVQMIKFWLRVHSDWTVSPLVKDACSLATNSSLPWANFIKQILDSTGLSYVWLNPAIVDPQQICTELAERLTDQYKQNWQSDLRETTGKLRTYKLIKKEFKSESYLDLPPHMRVPVARLRTSTHPLRIEIGRYNLPTPIPAEERYCWFCQNSLVEDECHFLFDCSLYDTTQEKSALLNYCSLLNPAFPHLNNVDKWRFISESAATDTHLTYIFSKYVSCAFDHRRSIVSSL